MKVILPLNGAVNKDKNQLYIDSEKGEVVSRKNCRVTSTEGGRVGVNCSIRSMELVATLFPVDGVSKIIGFVEDKERDGSLFFVYNSVGHHAIYKFYNDFASTMNFADGVLNFQEDEIIDATILGDYCVFASDYNPPRKLNVLLDDVAVAALDSYDIQLAVRPPSSKPTTSIGSNSLRKVNKLVGKTFQFASMYIYDDYTYSVLSPYSDLAVSSSVFAAESNTYEDNNIGNYVQVGYDLGTDNVRAVRLLAREGNTGDWFIVEEYEKNGETEYAIRTYPFYNDVARQGLAEKAALDLYSDVPRTARTALAVQNRIGLGRVKKGYNKTKPNVDYSITYETVVPGAEFDTLAVSDGVIEGLVPENGYYYVDITIPSDVAEGEIISINLFNRFLELRDFVPEVSFEWNYLFTYTVAALEDADTVCTSIQYDFKYRDIYSIIDPVYYGNINTWQLNATKLGGGVVRLEILGVHDSTRITATNIVESTSTRETVPSGVSTFKSGSYYNVGVLFYDEFSRTSGVLMPQSVYVPHAGERAYTDAFDRARIAFTIPVATTGVPSWAKYYRFAVTESVNFAGVYPFVSGQVETVTVDGQEVYAINMPSNLQYEFEKGDYLQLEVDSGVAITSTIVKNIIGTRTTVEISGTDTAGYWLLIPKGEELAADYEEKLVYIYRTKNTVQDLIYFEDSNTYNITNGVMQTLTGYVGGEDAWYVTRKFEWTGGDSTKVVEDFYINVDDALRAYSKGRVVVEFDTLGEITLQDFVWSFNYLDNTKINGISTFNSLNRKQLDEKDGQIQRIRLVGDVIKVIQDNKETSMYVGKAQISDASGNLQLVKSNDFIGATNPSEDEWGSRYPLSIVVVGRDMFYWDGDLGEVIMSSPNGQHPISRYGMKSEFLALKDESPTRVFSYFDKKNGEYVITFEFPSYARSLSYKKDAYGWNMDYLDLTDGNGDAAEFYGVIGNQNYSFLKESIYKHEAGSSYNVFLGDSKPFSVKGVINAFPNEEKCLRALKTDSNRGLNTIITSPITNTRTLGQKTVLYPSTYKVKDGGYFSSVFKNILTTLGENLGLIHTGTDITGKYIEVEFTDSGSTECQLRLVTANISVNK